MPDGAYYCYICGKETGMYGHYQEKNAFGSNYYCDPDGSRYAAKLKAEAEYEKSEYERLKKKFEGTKGE